MVNVDPIFRYKFKDESLIRLALTHRSSSGSNNERLEFLGDSILSVIVSEELMKTFCNLFKNLHEHIKTLSRRSSQQHNENLIEP